MNFKDRTGNRYGRLTVSELASRAGGKVRWRCHCICGEEIVVVSNNLSSGNTTSCGCFRYEQQCATAHRRKGVFADLTGHRFVRLAVMSFAGALNGKPFWNCLCDCGAMKVVMGQSLRQGKTVSCGCFHREDVRRYATKHGRSGTAAYKRIYKVRREERQNHLDTGWTRRMERALRRLQPVCVVCGAAAGLATDHVLPLSKGHGLVPGNAVRLCISCNSTKHNKDLAQLPQDWQTKIAAAAAAFQTYWES